MLEEHATENQQKIVQLEKQFQDEELRSKQLEEQLSIEKNNIDEQALNKQQQLSQEVEKLQNLLQNEKNAKIEQEKIFQSALDKFKDYHKLEQLKNEALETNKLLSQQLNEFCLKLTEAEPLCEITSSLIDEAVTLRKEIDDADDTLNLFHGRIQSREEKLIFPELRKDTRKFYLWNGNSS